MTKYAIIPQPVSVQYNTGMFECRGLPQISTKIFPNEENIFNEQIKSIWGEQTACSQSGLINLVKTEDLPNEAYRLEILRNQINLSASDETGAYRGLQTLRQLFLSSFSDNALSITCGVIEDKPRFPWRGFMLDCSRYFYSIDFIKKLLDTLSLQHINIFHWHLTDDQGWRLPVDQYPLLTEIGSVRYEHRLSGTATGGFYTEAEIIDIVSYAASRHIEVVPEVDFPGHASAILAAYPELGCTGGPYHVEDRFGIFLDVLCAGNDKIFPLADSVFDSLAKLFPSRYVHIGGDEVLVTRWTECPKCQKRLAKLGLENPAQLQSWITYRLCEMLHDRGKIAIGWDEILEDSPQFPLPKNSIVMSWRGQEGGHRAAALGHKVIMSPQHSGCYLDHKQIDRPEEPGRLGVGTLEQAYNMNPITPNMDETAASLVLGGQGNLWSEIIYAGKFAEYMIFPRICAIAETLWSQTESKNFDDFLKRLKAHQHRLDKLGILYAVTAKFASFG